MLVSNLLPVTSYPTQVWSADTEFRDPKEVFEVVKHPDSFILKQGKLYTFARLSAEGCSLREVVDVSSISQTPENTSVWLSHPDKKLWLMTLLNKSLNDHMRALPTWKMGKGRFFFPPDQGGVRRWKNPGDQSREVAGPTHDLRRRSLLGASMRGSFIQAVWRQFFHPDRAGIHVHKRRIDRADRQIDGTALDPVGRAAEKSRCVEKRGFLGEGNRERK